MLAENAHLRAALRAVRHQDESWREANANLRVERDAADTLLGVALDEALKASRT